MYIRYNMIKGKYLKNRKYEFYPEKLVLKYLPEYLQTLEGFKHSDINMKRSLS